jgi:UDP-galactopyranose mutase
MMGRELYEEFFAGYTAKQWGRHPTELPASVLKRLPMRFTYDDRYFADPYEVLPVDGYTAAVGRMLDHERIDVTLGSEMSASDLAGVYGHIFWTGPLDAYFQHVSGRLSYRTLDFEWQTVDGEFQGCSVMNYSESEVGHTRIADHKYFEPWTERDASVIGIETSRECGVGDIPYYPVRLADDQRTLGEYVELAKSCSGVTFLGRLGTYRYLDMDGTIHEALEASRQTLQLLDEGRRVPVFFTDPLA